MALTKEQQTEAEVAYINSRLSPHDLHTKDLIEQNHARIANARSAIEALQSTCAHPLIARDTKNEGYSGEVWERGHYWTSHQCGVCGLRWRTNQRWNLVGTKTGVPSDEEATNNPREE